MSNTFTKLETEINLMKQDKTRIKYNNQTGKNIFIILLDLTTLYSFSLDGKNYLQITEDKIAMSSTAVTLLLDFESFLAPSSPPSSSSSRRHLPSFCLKWLQLYYGITWKLLGDSCSTPGPAFLKLPFHLTWAIMMAIILIRTRMTVFKTRLIHD